MSSSKKTELDKQLPKIEKAISKIIEKEMDSETNERLVSDFVKKLDNAKIGGLPC